MKNTIEIAKQLGITLKKIGTFKGHEGMLGINADICLNGKAFAHAYDDARGGEMDITPIGYTKENKDTIAELEEKLKTFPEYKVELGNSNFMMRDSLDDIVNALVDAHLHKQELKKLENKGILLEGENGNVSVVSWQHGDIGKMIGKFGAAQVIEKLLQPTYDQYKAEGKNILNVEYLKKVGVKI
ncbi:MAG: hypothetical protein AABY15_06635 [Nanoarchaeota archaeon]